MSRLGQRRHYFALRRKAVRKAVARLKERAAPIPPACPAAPKTRVVDFPLKDRRTLTLHAHDPLTQEATLELVDSSRGTKEMLKFQLASYAFMSKTVGRIEWFAYLQEA